MNRQRNTKKQTAHKTAELVRSGYQPSKHEMNEEFSVHKKDGSEPSLSDLTKAVLQPVKIRLIGKPRNRRGFRH